MQYGMPTLLECESLEDNIALCQRLGLNFVELNMNFPLCQIDKLEDPRSFLDAADKAGIYYTLHLDERMDIADFNPLVAEAYRETVRRTIHAAKALLPLRDRFGDPAQPLTITMHMNHGVYITLPDRRADLYEKYRGTYLAAFTEFRRLCEEWIGDAAIRICIENTDGFRSFEREAIELLLQSPCFALTWDIGHSKAVGEKDVPFLMEHRERIAHFHIHDGREVPPKNHLALGDGEIPLEERLDLAEARNARCVLETKTIEALEKSVCWLQEHNRM